MTRTQSIIAGSVVAAILVAGSVMQGQADARPHHWQSCPGNEYVYDSLTPEKQAQYDSIMDDFTNKISPLRDKIRAKRIELDTLGRAANPDPKAIGKASEELVALHNEFAREREAMFDRVSKELGINMNTNDRRGFRSDCPAFGDCAYGRGYGNQGRDYPMNRGYHRGYHHYGM